jgi:hypothetical protein
MLAGWLTLFSNNFLLLEIIDDPLLIFSLHVFLFRILF